ncbi:TlpA family protein disulfide reductase [Candidatus Uabimicrobium sp. HlEnr_7]|uniref:TlpA family protein disulfide reductase n=1 Tax=Candidatus Uabimicrobium helgolandensis TaxID=3095367 RepID=UPI0035563525
MPHLNKLDKKYGEKGLSVIAVTAENVDIVKAFSVHHTNMDYKVYTKSSQRGFPNMRGIPQAHIIAADGSIAWSGRPSGVSDKKIEELLKERSLFFYKKFKGCSKSAINNILKKKYGKAYKYADKNSEKIDTAKDMVSYLAKIATRQLEHTKSLVSKGELAQAYIMTSKLQKEWSGTDTAKKAYEIQKEIKNRDNKKEYRATKQLAKMVSKIPRKSKDKARLALVLKKFAKKYDGTKAAQNALDWAKTLESSWP